MCDDIFKKNFQTKYDISFSVGLIEHFDDPSVALRKHVEILKKDGIMLLLIPNLTGLQGKIFKSKIWFSKEQLEKRPKDWIFGMRDITVEDFEKWCLDAGLKDVKILPAGGFLPTLIIDSLKSRRKSKIFRAQIVNRYSLLPILMLINIPLLFRLNSFMFSPYLIAVGKKI
jgi:SAM-dependent methyltransferase